MTRPAGGGQRQAISGRGTAQLEISPSLVIRYSGLKSATNNKRATNRHDSTTKVHTNLLFQACEKPHEQDHQHKKEAQRAEHQKRSAWHNPLKSRNRLNAARSCVTARAKTHSFHARTKTLESVRADQHVTAAKTSTVRAAPQIELAASRAESRRRAPFCTRVRRFENHV